MKKHFVISRTVLFSFFLLGLAFLCFLLPPWFLKLDDPCRKIERYYAVGALVSLVGSVVGIFGAFNISPKWWVGGVGFLLNCMTFVLVTVLAPGVLPLSDLDESRIVATEIEMKRVEIGLDHFNQENGYYPSEELGIQLLLENSPSRLSYLSKIPKDAWGNDLRYRNQEKTKTVEIISFGADGIEGGKCVDADLYLKVQ